jgi:SdpC family antimicrobial peptide
MNPHSRRGLAAGMLSLALAAGVLAAACGSAEPTAAPAAYGGEAQFRGIFFGEGPVAAQLPEEWQRRTLAQHAEEAAGARAAARLRAGHAVLQRRIRAADPHFFAAFAREVRSGDHFRVQRAMADAQALSRALAAPDASVAPDAEAPVLDIALVLPWIVYDPMLAVVLPFPPIYWMDDGSGASRLQSEQVVDLVATRLAPS